MQPVPDRAVLREGRGGAQSLTMAEPLSTRAKLTWVAILYFAEGFPFGLLFDAFPVYFRTHGVSLADIGLISLAGLPWTLKFL